MISEIRDKVKKFLKETIGAEGIRIIMVEKDDGGWVAEAEVAEKNQYLASIKPEYRVFDKSHYIIKLNADLEVTSYKRGEKSEEEKEA
ncbi:gas vesicle protein [Patescibacteria group bacterium]|nr:gas vesicle protein [Patescibacteria group bacterium]